MITTLKKKYKKTENTMSKTKKLKNSTCHILPQLRKRKVEQDLLAHLPPQSD
jgi:hypothetical protein